MPKYIKFIQQLADKFSHTRIALAIYMKLLKIPIFFYKFHIELPKYVKIIQQLADKRSYIRVLKTRL